MLIPLILDSFTFDPNSLESPESLTDVAGTQRTAQHDFPGGFRTHQVFGYFPSALHWKARFSSPDASDRVEAVKRILYAGQEVELSYGERAWLGRLIKFCPTIRHSWLYEYELEFWPRIDISSGSPEPIAYYDQSYLMNLNALAIQSMIDSAATGGLYQNIALVVAGPVATLLSAVQVGLLAAEGNPFALSALSQLAITAAVSGVIGACQPLAIAASEIISSPAADLIAYASVIGIMATAPQQARWQVTATNPNLAVLAAQYYGDATQWGRIAAYNGLSDPQPIGQFQLLIPPPQ